MLTSPSGRPGVGDQAKGANVPDEGGQKKEREKDGVQKPEAEGYRRIQEQVKKMLLFSLWQEHYQLWSHFLP